MRFMVIVKANEESEAGGIPDEKMLTEMTRYNEELVKAGVMVAGEGLLPSSNGARVVFTDERPTVLDGPFAETKELVAGFWIFEVKSRDEALEWVKRCPMGPGAVVEVRQVATAEDFGDAYTSEVREAEDRMRAQLEERNQS